jgi:hypothetical protein
MMRKFEPERQDVTAGDVKCSNEELHNFQFSSVFAFGKSRKMKWKTHISLMEDNLNAYRNLRGNLRNRDHSKT